MLQSSLSVLRALPSALARSRGRPARKRQTSRKLILESLEDRLVPAILNPSPSAVDGQFGSLREDVITANENLQDNTINLQAGVYQLTVANPAGHEGQAAQGDLNLTPAGHTIIIQGAGAGVSIIDANGIDRAFEVLPGVTAIFRNLTIRNGVAQDFGGDGQRPDVYPSAGGGIFNLGNLTLDHVVVENCSAVGGNGVDAHNLPLLPDGTLPQIPATGGLTAQGGGIYNGFQGTLTLMQSTVRNNGAEGGAGGKGISFDVNHDGAAGGDGEGGGIFSLGMLNVVQSTISGNTASGGIGGDGGMSTVDAGGRGGQGGNAHGGGLFTGEKIQTRVTDSTISGNAALGWVGGMGGAGVQGGDPRFNIGTNGGQGGAGGNGQGGGLYALDAVFLSNSTVAANDASQGDGGMGGPGSAGNLGGIHGLQGFSGVGEGGGIFTLEDPGVLVSVSSLIAGNSALYGDQDVHGTFGSASNTLLGSPDPEGFNNVTNGMNGNLVGTEAAPLDPKLGPLQDNGGPTQTMALLPGSPALDAGSNPLGLATDQRGYGPRAVGAAPDIGAFELGAPPPAPVPAPAPAPAPGAPAAPPVVHGVIPQVVRMRRGRQQLLVLDAATGAVRFAVYPFGPGFRGNFAVTTRDVNGDSFADVIVRAVVGSRRRRQILVAVFSGLDGSPLPAGLA